MKVLTCRAALKRLDRFHDEELPVADQIAVGAHLEWCSPCAAAFADLCLMRETLRAPDVRATLSEDERETLRAAVVSRVRAERTASFPVRVRAMFDDLHLVYAGLGAAFAALVCTLSVATMLRFATREHPGSLAAIVKHFVEAEQPLAREDASTLGHAPAASPSAGATTGSPGSNENPVWLDGRVIAPVALNGGFATLVDPGSGSSDSVFMIHAVVTREGTVSNPELVHASSGQLPIVPGTESAKVAENLMGAVSRARFEPARVDGLPVAVNMVWMVANTTVRADKPLIRRPSASKKPVAWRPGADSRPRPA